MVFAVLFLSFMVALAMALPIAWALGISSLGSLILLNVPLSTVPQKIFTGMDIFPLMCIPFFVMAGDIMAYGGLSKRLLGFAVAIVGSIRGGLACANVIASMIFGGITGSAIADASALGPLTIDMMTKNGYDRTFSAALVSASACIGPIIPPSIPVVVYAMAVSGVSIGGLFAAGILPGVMIGISLMSYSVYASKKRNFPKREERITPKQFLIAWRDAILALLMPLIILGGIFSGVFTPTEAAAVSAVYAFVVSYFVYGELKLSDLPEIFLSSAITTAVVMIIIGTANIFGMIVAFEQLGMKLERLISPLGHFGFILVVNIILLWIGTFMDQNPAILILAPVFAPIAYHLGMSPIHFGFMMIMNLIIGLITPPMGQVLFVVAPIAKIPLDNLAKAIWPFVLAEVIVLLLVAYFPFFTVFIPALLGYTH
jgi:C4-dicarboxylate transporter DctM subunit